VYIVVAILICTPSYSVCIVTVLSRDAKSSYSRQTLLLSFLLAIGGENRDK